MIRPDGIFYGWVIVAVMWLVNFSTMATGNLSFGLFVIPMGVELGMSRSQLGWAVTDRRIAAGASSFIVGRLLDRYGPRVMIPVSGAIIGVALLAVSRADTPWQVIALFGVLGLTGLAAPQNIMTSVPVAKWFQRKRGMALALAVSGVGIGGVFFLPFTQMLLGSVGWRTTWVVMAVIFMAMSIPLSAIFLRRQPEDMGLEVDGRPTNQFPSGQAATAVPPAPEERSWTVREAFRTSTMWKLLLAFALAGVAQGGTSVHRIPYWIESGFDAQLVSFSFAGDAGGAATMALFAGWMADRVPIRIIAVGSFSGLALAMGFALIGRNEFFLFASGIIFGLSVGAGMIVHSYIFAAYFGRAFLGSIRGIVLPVMLISAGLGAPLVGYIYDSTGNYVSSWWMILTLNLIAALIISTATRPAPPMALAEPVVETAV
ncbi:MAG TPA: MFS transporter [Dehalococcoidia bacterium]|nr:MFS transporter [Dehalococcoidia bacterium]